jgi:hypothetical protein
VIDINVEIDSNANISTSFNLPQKHIDLLIKLYDKVPNLDESMYIDSWDSYLTSVDQL